MLTVSQPLERFIPDGDALLKRVAGRIAAVTRSADPLARDGADTFMVAVGGRTGLGGMNIIATNLPVKSLAAVATRCGYSMIRASRAQSPARRALLQGFSGILKPNAISICPIF